MVDFRDRYKETNFGFRQREIRRLHREQFFKGEDLWREEREKNAKKFVGQLPGFCVERDRESLLSWCLKKLFQFKSRKRPKP
jgi:hypothetical protein